MALHVTARGPACDSTRPIHSPPRSSFSKARGTALSPWVPQNGRPVLQTTGPAARPRGAAAQGPSRRAGSGCCGQVRLREAHAARTCAYPARCWGFCLERTSPLNKGVQRPRGAEACGADVALAHWLCSSRRPGTPAAPTGDTPKPSTPRLSGRTLPRRALPGASGPAAVAATVTVLRAPRLTSHQERASALGGGCSLGCHQPLHTGRGLVPSDHERPGPKTASRGSAFRGHLGLRPPSPGSAA